MKIDPRKMKKATSSRPTLVITPELEIVNGELINVHYVIPVEDYKQAVAHVISKEGKESDGVAIVFSAADNNDQYADFVDVVRTANDKGEPVEALCKFRIMPSWSGIWHGCKLVEVIEETLVKEPVLPVTVTAIPAV